MSLQTPDGIRKLQRKLYLKAKAEPAFRFYLLYDKICREDILRHAYVLARANWGAPGVDGATFTAIEAAGLEEWLAGLRKDLVAQTYRTAPGRGGVVPQTGAVATARSDSRRSGTGWCSPPPSWCWSRSSRRISIPRPTATGRGGAGLTRSRRCTRCSAAATPMWWTPICRSISTRFRIRT